MGAVLATLFGAPEVPGPTKPTRFGGGFSGAKLSDSIGDNNPKNAATLQRLNKSLDPEGFRKILFGNTAAHSDVVYFETWNNGKNYDEIVVVAGHQINSFGSTFYYKSEALTFDGSGNNNERFGTKMNLKTKTIGVTGTNLACGAGAKWTSTSSLTGCAYFSLRTIYGQKLYPNGVETHYVLPCEGALVYDPRLDNTYGTGTHDATSQATWEYNDGTDDIGRNPALQILWYLLGWKEIAVSGEITCGMGVSEDDIDMDSFIQAANDFDVLGWFSDCGLSMGDSHAKNLGILKAGCGATLTDAGGRYSIHAPVDDTGTVAVAFTADDISGDSFSWDAKRKLQQQFNSISGSFIDPATLYQPRAYPKVADTSYEAADGYKKNRLMDFQTIQDSDQAQELNRIILNQSRFEGIFKVSTNYKGLLAEHHNVVTWTLDLFGWTGKKFRIKKQGITSQGYLELELEETDTSIYSAGTISTLPAPGTGLGYDPSDEFVVATLAAAKMTQTGAGTPPTISDGLKITWTDPGEPVAWTEIQYRINGDTDWLNTSPVYYPLAEISLAPLESETQYDIQARHVSVTGVIGNWSATVNQTTGANRDTEAGLTGSSIVQNQFPNHQFDPAGFINHLYIVASDLGGPNATDIVSATTEGIATPPTGLGDDVLQFYEDGVSATYHNILKLTAAGIDYLNQGDKYTWGAYFINTDVDESVAVAFKQGGGHGQITVPANTTSWTWLSVTGTAPLFNSIIDELDVRGLPAAGTGKAYMVGMFWARGSFDLSSPPDALGSFDATNALNNEQNYSVINDDAGTQPDDNADITGENFSSGILYNWNVNSIDADGLAAGVRVIEGATNRSAVTYTLGPPSFVRLDGAIDSSVAVGWPAIPIDDQNTYEVTVYHRSGSSSATGFYFRAQELNSALSTGKTHIGSGGGESMVQTRTSFNDIAVANSAMPGTAWKEDVYIYTPTAGTKFATFSPYNWTTYTGTYDVDYIQIRQVLDETNLDALNLLNGPADAGATLGASDATISGEVGTLANVLAQRATNDLAKSAQFSSTYLFNPVIQKTAASAGFSQVGTFNLLRNGSHKISISARSEIDLTAGDEVDPQIRIRDKNNVTVVAATNFGATTSFVFYDFNIVDVDMVDGPFKIEVKNGETNAAVRKWLKLQDLKTYADDAWVDNVTQGTSGFDFDSGDR